MQPVKSKKRIILADKISGCEAVPFAVSVCVHVIELGNRRVKFKFPFWGFSIPAGSNYGTEWIDNDDYQAVTERILRTIARPKGLDYFKRIKKRISKEEKILEREARELAGNLKGLSDIELVGRYDKFIEKYSYYYGLGIVTFLYEGTLSEKLMQSLNGRYSNAVAFLSQLFRNSYRSFMLSSENYLLKIKKEKTAEKRQKLLKKYIEDFFYIQANYGQAPLVTKRFVQERIAYLEKHKVTPAARVKLKLAAWEKQAINLLKINEAIRDKRKQINMIGSFMMFRFLEEAQRRQQIKPSLSERAFWFEYCDLVLNTKKILPILKKRTQITVGLDRKGSFYLSYAALREKTNSLKSRREIVGTPASLGVYRGAARKIMTSRDFSAFKSGEILVTTMTRPDFLPLMKKAGAIVTDEGGLTCHAAIVARELGIPCIVGVKNATSVLRNGDFVEVDAEKGIVKIINLLTTK